jgi:hypothetical protein
MLRECGLREPQLSAPLWRGQENPRRDNSLSPHTTVVRCNVAQIWSAAKKYLRTQVLDWKHLAHSEHAAQKKSYRLWDKLLFVFRKRMRTMKT